MGAAACCGEDRKNKDKQVKKLQAEEDGQGNNGIGSPLKEGAFDHSIDFDASSRAPATISDENEIDSFVFLMDYPDALLNDFQKEVLAKRSIVKQESGSALLNPWMVARSPYPQSQPLLLFYKNILNVQTSLLPSADPAVLGKDYENYSLQKFTATSIEKNTFQEELAQFMNKQYANKLELLSCANDPESNLIFHFLFISKPESVKVGSCPYVYKLFEPMESEELQETFSSEISRREYFRMSFPVFSGRSQKVSYNLVVCEKGEAVRKVDYELALFPADLNLLKRNILQDELLGKRFAGLLVGNDAESSYRIMMCKKISERDDGKDTSNERIIKGV